MARMSTAEENPSLKQKPNDSYEFEFTQDLHTQELMEAFCCSQLPTWQLDHTSEDSISLGGMIHENQPQAELKESSVLVI